VQVTEFVGDPQKIQNSHASDKRGVLRPGVEIWAVQRGGREATGAEARSWATSLRGVQRRRSPDSSQGLTPQRLKHDAAPNFALGI